MVERPVLFKGEMVRALLAGTKTQTRRVVKPQPDIVGSNGTVVCRFTPDDCLLGRLGEEIRCPYGQAGNRLWVREAWRASKVADELKPSQLVGGRNNSPIWYEAQDEVPFHPSGYGKLRPSMFMPRWASRITLDITGVCVERLNSISQADAIAEGIGELVPLAKRSEGLTPAALAFAAAATVDRMPRTTRRGFLAGALAASLGFVASPSRPWEVMQGRMDRAPSPQQLYALLWESINGAGSWNENPFVWVVAFRRMKEGTA